MNNREIQKQELAGKRKLTAVSIYVSPSRKVTRFLMLNHDSRGKAILPMEYLNQMVAGGVARGTTISVG